MNIKNLDEIPLVASTLKVVASETLDISKDLESTNEKSIAELMNEEKEDSEKNEKDISR